MLDLKIDEPTSLRTTPVRTARKGRRAMLGGLLALQLMLIGGTLAYFEGWRPFAGPVPTAPAQAPAPPPIARAPFPDPTRTAPAGPAPGPMVVPRPAPKPESAAPRAIAEARGNVAEKAESDPPADILREKSLQVIEGMALLGGEAEVGRAMKGAQARFQAYKQAVARIEEIGQIDAEITRLHVVRIESAHLLEECQIRLDALPKGGSVVRQGLRADVLAARTQLNHAVAEHDKAWRTRPTMAERRELEGERARLETAFRKDVTELRGKVGTIVAEYDRLTTEADVQSALRDAGARLGPSDRFREIQVELGRVERAFSGRR